MVISDVGVPLAEFRCGTCDGVSVAVIGDAERDRFHRGVDDGLLDGFVDEQFDRIGADGCGRVDGASDFGIAPFSGGEFEELSVGREIDRDERLFILELACENDETGLVFVSRRDAFGEYGMECAESQGALNDGEEVCAVKVHVCAVVGFLVACQRYLGAIEKARNASPGEHDAKGIRHGIDIVMAERNEPWHVVIVDESDHIIGAGVLPVIRDDAGEPGERFVFAEDVAKGE